MDTKKQEEIKKVFLRLQFNTDIEHADYANVINTNKQVVKEVVGISSNQQRITVKQTNIAWTLFHDNVEMIDDVNCAPFCFNPSSAIPEEKSKPIDKYSDDEE